MLPAGKIMEAKVLGENHHDSVPTPRVAYAHILLDYFWKQAQTQKSAHRHSRSLPVYLGERQERAMPGSYTNAGRGPWAYRSEDCFGCCEGARIYTFLGFRVSVRDVPQRLKPEDFIELYRRSKDLLHPAWDTVKPKKV
jgi:hypothetical protein